MSARRSREFDPLLQPPIGTLGSGEMVVDRTNSHSHVTNELLERALFLVDSRGRNFIVEEVDFGEVIGLSQCIETYQNDNIVVAYRRNRKGPSRFVLDHSPEPSSKVTVILMRDDKKEGVMILISAWVGDRGMPEPWDPIHDQDETLLKAQQYWSNHALVWDPVGFEVDLTRPFGREEDLLDHLEAARFL